MPSAWFVLVDPAEAFYCSCEIPGFGEHKCPCPISRPIAATVAILSRCRSMRRTSLHPCRRQEPGYRAATEFGIESGLDGFVSEDGDSDPSSLLTTAQPGDTADGNAARLAPSGRSERDAGRQSRSTANVLSMATRAISPGTRKRRRHVGPRKDRDVRAAADSQHALDRLASTAALVGQTGARVTQSLSSTLTQPWWRIDPRLAFLLVLSFLGFAGLWSVTQRLSNPAASLAESAGCLHRACRY